MKQNQEETMNKNIKSIAILSFVLFLFTACKPKETHSSTNEPVEKEAAEVVLKACTKEAKQCTNGKTVGRNPKNNCDFDPCETPNPKSKKNPVMCSADVNECPDGSYVGRDHNNNCKFKDCPNSEQ